MAELAKQVTIGPEQAGRRMSFDDFQRAEPQSGHNYELGRGVVEVTDIPGRAHALVLDEIETELRAYRRKHKGKIHFMGSGSAAKLELPEFESERHPDCSVYLTPMPVDDYPWDKWTPEIAIEVVSPGSLARQRDYVTKREEYLAAGVSEYWIVDPQERAIMQLQRHGDRWNERRLIAGQSLESPRLPGFGLAQRLRQFCVLTERSPRRGGRRWI